MYESKLPPFSELYQQASKPIISFEFFPPRNPAQLPQTKALIERLCQMNPDFVTVTYGAGGGTQAHTAELVRFIVNDLHLPAAAHLTCVGHSRSEIDNIVSGLMNLGIRHIVALRGDPPKYCTEFIPHPDGFSCARDLTKFLRHRFPLSLATAGYPESHPEAHSAEAEINYLAEKVLAGAELILTQLFFSTSLYTDFCARTAAAGINVPIVPGVMPVSNLNQIERFTTMCGATIPTDFHQEMINSHDIQNLGTRKALMLSRELIAAGAPGLHLYTLNRAEQVEAIVQNLRSTNS